MNFIWKKKNSESRIVLNIYLNIYPTHWALPLSIGLDWGKYNVDVRTDEKGAVKFVETTPQGWFVQTDIGVLFFSLFLELDRWYK